MNESKIQVNNEILYTEWVPAGKFVKISVIFVLLLSIFLGFIAYVFWDIRLVFVGLAVGVFDIFIFLMYWNYRGLRIILTNNLIEVIYGIFNHKRIPMKRIIACDITKARFRTYGGVGIRFGLNGSWIYNTDFGEAVKLTFQSGRPFVFSTRNPEKICNLINKFST